MDAVELHPLKNGKWRVAGVKGTFGDRRAAVRAAREAAGSVEAFDQTGRSLGFTEPSRRIELYRVDGSLYGELPSGRSTPDTVATGIEPAGEGDEAGDD